MPDDKTTVWNMFAELSASERHFNDLQHNYRVLCSTWILAAFAGFGFILATKDVGALFPRELLVSVLSVAAAVGTTLLWTLDLRVYHQLLDCCFVEGLRLERENSWLPQIRTRMLKTQAEHGVLSRVVWFYVVSVVTVLIFGGVLFTLYFSHHGIWQAIAAGIFWLVVTCVWAWLIHRHTISEPLKTHHSEVA